jgi:hypothetical protein
MHYHSTTTYELGSKPNQVTLELLQSKKCDIYRSYTVFRAKLARGPWEQKKR